MDLCTPARMSNFLLLRINPNQHTITVGSGASQRCVHVLNNEFLSLLSFRYWRYNEDMRTMDPGYPKPITIWKGIPDSPQGAFVDKANGSFCTPYCARKNGLKPHRENLLVFLIKTDIFSPSNIMFFSRENVEKYACNYVLSHAIFTI